MNDHMNRNKCCSDEEKIEKTNQNLFIRQLKQIYSKIGVFRQ